MEEPFNPYAAGEVQPQQAYVNPAAGLVVTPMALSAILGTKFWVKLIGWSMLLISILTLLGLFIGAYSCDYCICPNVCQIDSVWISDQGACSL